MGYKVKLEQFSGPLHLLLELIEKEELPITEVSLGSVTNDYLKHINVGKVSSEEMADFLVLATRLLLLKSHAILPREELLEEEDPSTLALQLKMYKEFIDASVHIESFFDATEKLYPRVRAQVITPEEFSVPENLDVPLLYKTMNSIMKKIEPLFNLQQSAMERVVSVKERLHEIHQIVLKKSRLTFKEMFSKGHTKVDVVVSFLALLELVKQQTISVVQSGAFSDIEIKKVD